MALFDYNTSGRLWTPSAEGRYVKAGLKKLRDWQLGRTKYSDASIQVIDLFSGCGGMSLGFAALGRATGAFRLVGAADIDLISLATYHKNFGVPAVVQDVRELANSSKALQEFISKLSNYESRRPTVLIGCAPCQGFSAHRKREWDKLDARNSLVEAFAKVAAKLTPEVVIMENVPEILSGRYWSYFDSFRKILNRKGYVVKQAIHNSASYGVPQERFRAIIIAMKRPFSMPTPRLMPQDFVTVREAISDLKEISAGDQDSDDPMHRTARHRQSTIDVIRKVPRDGGSRPPGVGPKCFINFKGFADVYGRLNWSKPSITITHYARNPASGRFVHPSQDRGLSMRESARLQSFPDGFTFIGPFDDVFRQIGEAVPPILSLSIAASVLANLRGECPTHSDEEIDTTPVNDSFAGVIAGMKIGRR